MAGKGKAEQGAAQRFADTGSSTNIEWGGSNGIQFDFGNTTSASEGGGWSGDGGGSERGGGSAINEISSPGSDNETANRAVTRAMEASSLSREAPREQSSAQQAAGLATPERAQAASQPRAATPLRSGSLGTLDISTGSLRAADPVDRPTDSALGSNDIGQDKYFVRYGNTALSSGAAQRPTRSAPSAPQSTVPKSQPKTAPQSVPEAPQQQATPAAPPADPRPAEAAKRYVEDNRRADVRAAGQVEVNRSRTPLSYLNKRFYKAVKMATKAIAGRIADKNYSGDRFYETMFSNADIDPHCVSIGTENLRQALREPNSRIIDMVNKALERAGESLMLDREVVLDDIFLLMEAVNSLEIEVTLEKGPVNTGLSSQVRTLRVHEGRGIGLHPTQAKAYNADFDGDPGFLNMGPGRTENYSRAMSYLIDYEGRPTIDPDYFPLDPITEENSEETLALLVDHYERAKPDVYKNTSVDVLDEVYEAYVEACNAQDWVGFLHSMEEVARKHENTDIGLYRDLIISSTLKCIYDFSIERRALMVESQLANMQDEYSNYNPPDADAEPLSIALINMVDEVVAGRPVPNIYDFTDMMNKFFGDPATKPGEPRKNVPFRLVADFAKAAHRTDLVLIGDPIYGINANMEERDYTVTELYDIFCCTALTKRIKGASRLGARETAVATRVRERIIMQVGLPRFTGPDNHDKQYRAWVNRFVDAYNHEMRMLKISQVQMRGGMRPVRADAVDSKYDGVADDLSNLDKALLDVFGDFTVEELFPDVGYVRYGSNARKQNTDTAVALRYRHMTLSDFVVKNRLAFISEPDYIYKKDRNGKIVGRQQRRDKHGNGLTSPKMDKVMGRIKHGTYSQMDVLLRVADRRSKRFGEYQERWERVTSQHTAIMEKVEKNLREKRYQEYCTDMIELLHLMSPGMFNFYEMDSMRGFLDNKWGQALLHSNGNVDMFRSTLVSMMVEYRINRASNILTEMKELASKEVYDEAVAAKVDAHDIAYETELEELAASSDAWAAIVNEMNTGSESFHRLAKKGGNPKWTITYAKDFWGTEYAQNFKSLLTFLKSNEVGYGLKMQVLADVTRDVSGYAYFTPNEMIGQLAHNSSHLYSGDRFDMDDPFREAIDDVKASINGIASYMPKAPSRIKKESDKLLKFAHADKPRFERMLKRFADEPGYQFHLSTLIAADAVSSAAEPTFSDSEKIKQQDMVTAYFEALCMQRSGGFPTHLQQVDNNVTNFIGYDQMSANDIVRILADPDIEMQVYDMYGSPATLSRASLCGGDTIDDVIKYLENNRQVCLACRRFIIGTNAPKISAKSRPKTIARMSAVNGWNVGDDGIDRVFSIINDRPRFLAAASLFTPARGNVGRNLAERYNESIRNLSAFIGRAAYEGWSHEKIVKQMETLFHFNEVHIRMFTGIEYEAVENLYSDVLEEIESCIGIIFNNEDLTLVTLPEIKKMDIDKSSIISYWSVRQQMSGARTAKMIGVEGSETSRNAAMQEYLDTRASQYMMVTDMDEQPNVIQQAERVYVGDDGIIVRVPEGWNISDETLERNPSKQVSSLGRFLELHRDKAAEEHNAKTKKYGDDGTNSIIKYFKFATPQILKRYGKENDGIHTIQDRMDLRHRIAMAPSRDKAVEILADAIMEADVDLKYTGFTRADYWNIADVMLGQNTDGTLVIRSLEQLATATRHRITDEAIASKDRDIIMAEIGEIISTVGTDADTLQRSAAEIRHHVLYNIPVQSVTSSTLRIDRALRPYSSSKERNYDLIKELFGKFAKDIDGKFVIPSREAIESNASEKFRLLEKEDKDFADSLKGLMYPSDRWVKRLGGMVHGTDWSKVYDYLGRPQDPDFIFYPGPTFAVLFDTDPSDPLNQKTIEQCRTYGTTAVFTSAKFIPKEYIEDAIHMENDIYLLPFFDMMLNGSMSEPIVPAPGQAPMSPDNFTVTVEGTVPHRRFGDSVFLATRNLINRLKITFSSHMEFAEHDLFVNAREAFPDDDFTLMICTREDIENDIVGSELVKTDDGVELQTVDGRSITVDLGIRRGHIGFDREFRRVQMRLKEYQDRFDATGDNGIISLDDCAPDSIIGFAKVVINNRDIVLAPLTAFHIEAKGRDRVPQKFRIIDDPYVDPRTNSIIVKWVYSDSLLGHYIKFFEGYGATEKFIMGGEPIDDVYLQNGMNIDGFYPSATVRSRLYDDNKRLQTMVSLLMIPRLDAKYAYNFAELDGAFPDNPQVTLEGGVETTLKQALLDGQLGITDWMDVRGTIGRFHVDPEINSIVKSLVDKALDYGTVNPSILLATKTSTGPISYVQYTEFEAFLDTSYRWQNKLMKLMNRMQPSLCPESIDASSKGCLFHPVSSKDGDEAYGVLQMLVPYTSPIDGKSFFKPENVYISPGFFGTEFSGMKQVNFNTYDNSLSTLNVSHNMDGETLSLFMSLLRSDIGHIEHTMLNRSEAATDDIMVEYHRDLDDQIDGLDHVNIYSKGETELGRFLSNFTYTPIDLAEGKFNSIEGYWHYLGLPASCKERERLKSASGPAARTLGRKLKEKYGTEKLDDFQDRIRNAVRVKLTTYTDWKDDRLVLFPLEHYYVSNGKKIDQSSSFRWFTKVVREEMDRLLTVEPGGKRILGKEYGKVLALTGHRPKSLGWEYDLSSSHWMAVAEKLLTFCRENEIDTIVSGMALGFDQLGALVSQFGGMKLVAAVPMQGQENTWPQSSKDFYHDILDKADKQLIITAGKYKDKNQMQERNVWMVDNADIVVALWNGKSGGTGNCVKYAKEQGVEIHLLHPDDVFDEDTGFARE